MIHWLDFHFSEPSHKIWLDMMVIQHVKRNELKHQQKYCQTDYFNTFYYLMYILVTREKYIKMRRVRTLSSIKGERMK